MGFEMSASCHAPPLCLIVHYFNLTKIQKRVHADLRECDHLKSFFFQAPASGRAVAAVLLRVRAHRHHATPREYIILAIFSTISLYFSSSNIFCNELWCA